MKFNIEQLALHPRDPAKARALLAKMGMTNWAEDTVRARGAVFGEGPVENEAQLSFNYQATPPADDGVGIVKPLELEILHYTEGLNWIANDFSVSHLGMHCTEEELRAWRKFFAGEGIGIAQEVVTQSHTNPIIAGNRWYTYVIFGTRAILGVDIKLIVRRN